MEDRIQIYADGACRGNGQKNNIGGYGILLKYKHKTKEIKHAEYNTTNNRQEILSVINALKVLKKSYLGVDIYSDSAYVVNAINQKWLNNWQKNGWKTSQKKAVENKELWLELIEQMSRFENLVIHKVKGHSDNEGNIRADELANEAMDELSNKD